MHVPPTDPASRRTDWQAILTGYALVAAVPVVLWAVENPATAVATLGVVVGLAVAARPAWRLAHCLYGCRPLTVDLAGRVRLTITRPRTDDSS
ncbi:hypothetical protein [Natrinema sp. 1APR25-10V2]|uniref:hypothetical protein n=1 Tax=Natrinema sp. 1APR25-10V2 TaxID=2951081 RepID=UPI00287621D4|nr:hypothetical protein [Natrinema sp. 1APR25-10V2]MDS0474078.1 hypothetical protein [Natrinema sp. 1APR25-10V2]